MSSNSQSRLDRLYQMLRIRRFEEKCGELYGAEKIRGFLHLYIGEEAVAVGVMSALRSEDDVISTYREHGHALARGVPADKIMAEMFGKKNGCCHGRGGSMHLFDCQRGFFGGNAIVAGGIPLAVGMALAKKMRGQNSVAACLFGDGAVAEGEFHESLNLAALWKLPVLFLCENNFYAMGTALRRHQSQINLALKAQSYQIQSEQVDGMDVESVERATRQALKEVLETGAPRFLEFQTYRFRPHSMFDPDLYRSKSEISEWKKKDPIETFKVKLQTEGILNDSILQEMELRIQSELNQAIEFAEAGPLESPEELTRDVYA